ncbi:MAG: sugar ABC transporter substrate-binding protein [Acidimicrobiales bacterium]
MNSYDPSRRRFIQRMGIAGGGIVLGGGLLAACGGDDEESTGTAETGGEAPTAVADAPAAEIITSGLIGLTLNGLNDYTRGVATGAYAALEGTDFELQVIQGNYDPGEELANIENFLAQGAVGIVIQPNTAESAGAGAQAAAAQGVPVGNCIWPGPSDADEFFTGVAQLDSVEGGRLLGNYLLEVLPGGGKICVVQGVVGQGFSERIDEGLDEVLSGSGLEVVVREQGFFDRVAAVEVVQTAFQAHPDLVAVVDYAAAMSNGICQWLEDEGITDVVHVTSDADEEMVSWFGSPYLQATRYYSSAQTGLIATNAVVAALTGGTPVFGTPIDQLIATADNIEAIVAENPYMFFDYKDLVQDI